VAQGLNNQATSSRLFSSRQDPLNPGLFDRPRMQTPSSGLEATFSAGSDLPSSCTWARLGI